MEATRRIDRAMHRAFAQPDPAHGDRLGAMLASGRLCEAAPRLDHAICISMEHWRVWEQALSAVPIGIPGVEYAAFVDAAGIARVMERPSYDSSTLINPFRGLHLIPERLPREAVDQIDRASSALEKGMRTPDEWEIAWRSIRAAAQLVAPMRAALLAMTEGLAVAEYRRFRKNFGRTSASESAALAEALFHRAPERLGDAAAAALGLVEGEPLGAAVERPPMSERVFARAVLDAIDELHREVASWLDTHMLLPVLHLGRARSLAGRIDAVTSNRLKRTETLSVGWFGRLGAPPADEVDPSAELDEEAGYLTWRALRIGDAQLADAAHLAEDQATGRALERLSSELRRMERGAAE